MKTEMMQDILSKREGFTPPFQLATNERADAISVCYSPHLKLLSAEWIQGIDSDNLRHTIRLLARTAAVLRAELLLIAMPGTFSISAVDSQWIEDFMQTALRQSPIKKIARVVPGVPIRDQTPIGLKYQSSSVQCAYFDAIPKAQRWLLGDRIGELTEGCSQRIPLQFNLSHIRHLYPQEVEPNFQPNSETQHSAAKTKREILDVCTDFVSISIDHSRQLMQINWKKAPHSRQYRYGMIKACRALIEHRLTRLLLNNQRMGILTLEDQGWLVSMAQTMLPKSHLQKLAVVTSANALQQLSSENIGKRLQQASLRHIAQYFLLEEEAMDWLMRD